MKAYLAAALEDLIGEYVLNISKENLKLAALRGKIKLENVELDGDFIGSHVLGAVGLSGFGVLSCWARTLEINIPWTNLDAPTSMDIRGMHLLCVPLLPTTANRTYHGSQTLRCRAKRSALARFERNFFSGRIPGEGPQQDGGQTINYNYNGRRRRLGSYDDSGANAEHGDGIYAGADSVEISMNGSLSSSTVAKEKEAGLPALKQKIKAKIYERLVSSVSDVHIRCEVPFGGLNITLPQRMGTSIPMHDEDQKAFAFGLTMRSLSVRNVSEGEMAVSGSTSEFDRQDSGGSSMSDSGNKRHRKMEVQDAAVYWDDDSPFLISESNLMKDSSLQTDARQLRIAEAMRRMMESQTPGLDTGLAPRSPTRRFSSKRRASGPAHNYIVHGFSQTVHTTIASDASENSLSFAEVLPCKLDLDVTSRQWKQYQLLKNAVLSQQRFDTMLQRRPEKSPLDDPRAWWAYAISCVKHKPTSRSWHDVRQIVQCRKVYLELVVRNLLNDREHGGFHGGLTEDDSKTLDLIESLLPIETLLSFHLLALRRVCIERGNDTISSKKVNGRASRVSSFARKRSSSTVGRMLNSLAGSVNSWHSLDDDEDSFFMSDTFASDMVTKQEPSIKSTFPTTQTTCQLHTCKVRIRLGRILTIEFDLKGTSYSSGSGKADLMLDIVRFEVFDFVSDSSGAKVLAIEPDCQQDFDCRGTVVESEIFDQMNGPQMPILSPVEQGVGEDSGRLLPPNGVVCRVIAAVDHFSLSLTMSAHPATLLWNKACFDEVAEFFSSSTSQIQSHILSQMRAAATPVSYRAQMAVLYPQSLLIRVNAIAPKLYIPVSPHMLDGALLFDAGKLQMTLQKAERSEDMSWTTHVSGIRIMFAGETTGSAMGGKHEYIADLDTVSRLRAYLTTIVREFQVSIEGQTNDSSDTSEPVPSFETQTEIGSGRIAVDFGQIHLNLIDVEELARAIGRFYASGVILMKERASSRAPLGNDYISAVTAQAPESSSFGVIVVAFEKIEMALEQYSSRRTYLVQLSGIQLDRRESEKNASMSFSRLSIDDFTIVQLLPDTSRNQSGSYTRYLKPSCEPHHQLLGRISESGASSASKGSLADGDQSAEEPVTPSKKGTPTQTPLRTPRCLRLATSTGVGGSEFIRACHFHDGETNVDEVEVDIASALIRVTPISISDCTMWVARAIELVRVSSKEMERRIHARGKKAKAGERKDELNSSDDDELAKRDSSIVLRIGLEGSSILVGRPASEFTCRGRKPDDYVVQIRTSASIMVQSVENDDGTGSRTFHLSVVDCQVSVIPSFHQVKLPECEILSPMALDLRAVHETVGVGIVSYQDFSFHCQSMEWCLAPHDIRVVSSVVRKVVERLHLLKSASEDKLVVRSKKKGARIATRIRGEVQSFSISFSHSFLKAGMRPFIAVNTSQLKAQLEGCIDAMSGEAAAQTQMQLFDPRAGWQDLIEPQRFDVVIDQVPNELVISVSTPDAMNINLTRALIEEISNLERASHHSNSSDGGIKEATAKSFRSIFEVANETGVELYIYPQGASINAKGDHCVAVPPGSTVSLDESFTGQQGPCTLTLCASERQPLHNLPLHPAMSSSVAALLFMWHPNTATTSSGLPAEPVTEYVMQNQRLRTSISDVFSLDRGQDLLSSAAWSPLSSMGRLDSENKSHSFWLPPYLKDDAPAWSDMTSLIPKKKDDCVLPDHGWLWGNDWEVEVNADPETNDADGWEYATDFETFGVSRRTYKRGDLCRRRRWTRTRMNKRVLNTGVPSIVWEVSTKGDRRVARARSHLQLHNLTDMMLSFFGSCDAWDEEEYVGSAAPGGSLCVPIQLSLATHLRIASPKQSAVRDGSKQKIEDFFCTEQFMILATGITSSRVIRTSILVLDVQSIKKLHFTLAFTCAGGSVDVRVEPVLRVSNLLPCQLECQLGEIGHGVRKGARKIVQTEVISLGAGRDGASLSVDCTLSPHVSVRVPGYKWSTWKRVVNREANSETWRPTEEEELAFFDDGDDSPGSSKKELKTIVHFDQKIQGADSLDIICCIEAGMVPTIRFFAQYFILDKTCLGLSFTSGFSDVLQYTPERETRRKSYLHPLEANVNSLQLDMNREGHEWSLGMNGMSLYFSPVGKIAVSVEGDDGESSRWSSLLDVKHVMAESLRSSISVDQQSGTRRYELAYNVTMCPSAFSRTKVITFYPRYQIVNLLEGESLFVAQVDDLSSELCIPPQSSVHFHWSNGSLDPKIRLCSESGSFSRGTIDLEKCGVTAMRLHSQTKARPMVVQAEVSLATKKQDSAVVVTIWSSESPLYSLKNSTHHTIYCRQKLGTDGSHTYIWTLNAGESIGFGFDDPDLPHIIEWTWSHSTWFDKFISIDEMGSRSSIPLTGGSYLASEVQAHESTKVVLFSLAATVESSLDDDEMLDIALRLHLPIITMSMIDNASEKTGREILLLTVEGLHTNLFQREGCNELQIGVTRLQVDNFVYKAEHPVLMFCPNNEDIPFLHLSVVRSVEKSSKTIVIRYAAVRILDIDIALDRKTAETIAHFLHPLRKARDEEHDPNYWIGHLTSKMKSRYSNPSRLPRAPRGISSNNDANSGRIHLEELNLHPLRVHLTFTQEGLDWNPAVTEGLVVFQLIRGMASIADAPLLFTSFVVSNVFDSPQTLLGIVLAHYSSQLSSQILSILGSLVILKTPADILTNIGSGVRDFFYEPVHGLVRGNFLDGIETGTSSLARGVFTATLRGSAGMTELLSENLAHLTDEMFIDERSSSQKKFMLALKANRATQTIQDSLVVAGECVARGFRSGVEDITKQPALYAARHGSAGLVKGVGKALIGVLVKPVVGVGDAASVVLNHVSETAIDKVSVVKTNKRMRRALPSAASFDNQVQLIPYNEESAQAQKIITQEEMDNDAYLGHVKTNSHLLIASEEFLWVVAESTSKIRWQDIRNVAMSRNRVEIDTFSDSKSFSFHANPVELTGLRKLMAVKISMSNDTCSIDWSHRSVLCSRIPGVKAAQVEHAFGSVNGTVSVEVRELGNESEFIKQSCSRVNKIGSFMPNYFQVLDEEAWLLVSLACQIFKGLSSRRCLVAGMINGTGDAMHITAAKLMQGGSLCYIIPSIEYDQHQGVLHPGGAIIFFGWGAVPTLLQQGNVTLHVETNSFAFSLGDSMNQSTSIQVLPSWQVEFLEKSYDESAWWAKYWMLIKKR